MAGLCNDQANTCLELLKLGFLTRGAIVLGELYHRESCVFGPALIRAVEMEKNEAFYPRILVHDDVISLCNDFYNNHPGTARGDIIQDHLCRNVVNIFHLPEKICFPDGYKPTPGLNTPSNVIWESIERSLNEYDGPESRKEWEKWSYLKSFLEQVVFKELTFRGSKTPRKTA